jgi:hypothetical protein
VIREYRLHGLERMRARILKDRKTELALAVGRRAAAEHGVLHEYREEQRARVALAREIGDPAALGVWGELAEAHRKERGRAQQRLVQALEVEAQARESVALARQQLRVLERLRERIAEDIRLEELRFEERELNDRNAGWFARLAPVEGN